MVGFSMGLEAKCTLRLGFETFTGRAHLAADKLEFRGGKKFDLPFKAVKSAAAGPAGALQLKHAGGLAILSFTDRATAEIWALKISHPKNLIDKLGLKPDSRVSVLGVDDPDFLAQARQRLGIPPTQDSGAALDFIIYAADSPAALARLKSLKAHLQPAGAIWVVSLKGKAAKIKDTDVMRAARAAGLVDNKVCSFSATHTALKLVIPKLQRPG